eukprot:gene2934-1181_t
MKVFAVLLLLGILVGAFADPVKLDDNSAGTLDLLDEKVDVPDEDETVDEEPARAEDTETKDGTEEDSRRNRLRLCSVECSHSCTYYKWFFWNKGCSCYRCPAGYYRKCGKKAPYAGAFPVPDGASVDDPDGGGVDQFTGMQ